MKRGGSGDPGIVEARAMGPRRAPTLRRVVFLLVLGTLAAGSAGASERSVTDQLKRMSAAVRTLSYEGTLVYLHDNRVETLRIVHRIENGHVHEQIASLNGPLRTMTREQDEVTCELSKSHPFSVRRHGSAMELLAAKALDPNVLAAHYVMHPLGVARVAGRQTDVVGVIPRDELRYGYRFYLDAESGLPLKSDLMGQTSEPIEQVMFTVLNLLPTADSPTAKTGGADRSEAPPAEAAIVEDDTWRFADLPSGFDVMMHDHWEDGSGRPVQHFVLSDGLASVSVYVENGDQDGLEGATRIGAIHAAGGHIAGHQVTIVGEVPAATVDAVLASVRYGGDGGP
jgi:sigma-E factor negative regulatory protein RseB